MASAQPTALVLSLSSILTALAYVPGSEMFMCRGDTVVRRECCCAQRSELASPSRAEFAKLTSRCCCDVVRDGTAVPPAVSPRDTGGSPSPDQLAAVVSEWSPWRAHPSACPEYRWARPPPVSIAILRQKQSLLI